ncbi:hypothetical protein K1719_020964 [Acacia pycnantha]|nr:hypothetical protein K1719_020964 [Acacia pycnantha]
MEVLKDGASNLELMGLPRSGRSGKVTLVGKFGSDGQVKGTRMKYFADHQQKMMKKMVQPKRGSMFHCYIKKGFFHYFRVLLPPEYLRLYTAATNR